MTAPIFNFDRHRSDIEREVVSRVVERLAEQTAGDVKRSFQLALNDAAFHEIQRLERSRGKEADRLPGWHKLARRIGRLDEEALRDEAKRLAAYYVSDVVGHFDRRVYRFTSSMLPVGLGALFNAAEIGRGFGAMRDLSHRIAVEGDLAQLRRLAEIGTLVLVPTHSSNLDSIVLGWSLVHAGLPPVTYGAGKNLFTNPVLGYFMRNLGAYRVDRRLGHGIYKRVLKTYSQVLIERGYHSLFFPGGTRGRSGSVEQKLKLGLMGSAVSAMFERVQRGDSRPIFIVPVTINYPLVLEGESLIKEHLRRSGRAQYLVEDDEFGRLGRVAGYAMKVMALETNMVIRFGRPLDVLGNAVGSEGTSLSPGGGALDPALYFHSDGHPVVDPDRDAEYTRQLGAAVSKAFLRETVVMPTHFLGWLLFERERRMAPHLDLFTLLRTTSGDRHDFVDLCAEGERLRGALVSMECNERLRLSPVVRSASIDALIGEAVRTFGMYHTRAAVERVGEDVVVHDPKLLHFYGNRLSAWREDLREVGS